MKRVVDILVKRDGVTKERAIKMIEECREAILSVDLIYADEIIEEYLGLEPDYLEEIIYGL